jgi:hypothetical protein
VDSSVIPNNEVFEPKVRDPGGRSRIYAKLYSPKGAPATVDGSDGRRFVVGASRPTDSVSSSFSRSSTPRHPRWRSSR